MAEEEVRYVVLLGVGHVGTIVVEQDLADTVMELEVLERHGDEFDLPKRPERPAASTPPAQETSRAASLKAPENVTRKCLWERASWPIVLLALGALGAAVTIGVTFGKSKWSR